MGIFKDNDISNLKDRLSKKRLHTFLVSRGIESKVKLESRSPSASWRNVQNKGDAGVCRPRVRSQPAPLTQKYQQDPDITLGCNPRNSMKVLATL